jgi:hypothetical protein
MPGASRRTVVPNEAPKSTCASTRQVSAWRCARPTGIGVRCGSSGVKSTCASPGS